LGFVHLDCHSNFSLLYGGSSVEDLVSACAEAGMEALALTDRDGLYGAVPFFEAATGAGIKPIIGCDLSVGPADRLTRLTLLAKNDEGYGNLCRLVTERRLGEAPVSLEQLSRCSEGLFALCPEPGMLEPLLAIFGDSLYAELVNTGTRECHRLAESLIGVARSLGVPCAASNQVAFARPDSYDLHLTLNAIRLICPVTRIPPGEAADRECHLKQPGEMKEAFSTYPYSTAPEALSSTGEIADACEFRFNLGARLFPAADLPPGETPFSHLTKLCFEGAARRYHPLPPRALDRLHFELETIERLGFTPYFLVVNEIARFCRERGIPSAGRGSAAGSMVAYVLGITYIDPIEHDLYFERFLSSARDDPPDIDLDVSWCRRDEVLDFIYRRFGHDRVAMICTYATMKARMAVRDVAKAFGLPPDEVDGFTRSIPHCRASQIEAVASAIPSCRDLPADREPYRTILDVCARLDGFPRHLSIHVGGVVIADRPLTDLVPLERATKGLVITQYDMGPIERLGLIKMDILGQKGLSVVEDTAAWAGKNHAVRIDPDRLPRDDPDTFRLLREGRTLGVFQIESPAMRSLLQSVKPRNIEDLTLTIALVRPGASGSGMKELFLLRRAGREPVVYLHPDLEPILSESLGTFVYQEQVMKAAVAVAGFTPAEADGLRRAMTHQRSHEQMDAIRERFIERAAERGVPELVAAAVFESLAKFAGYGFPKAHAATYGEFSYQAAYLKAHFPAEFMAAVLVNEAGFYHHSVYVEEAKRLGVRVALPDVNRGEGDYHVRGDGILYYGLLRVKGIHRTTVESLIAAREDFPFTSLSDFLARVELTEEEAATLIKCGAFDSLENTRPELLWKLKMMYPQARAAMAAGRGRRSRAGRSLPLCPEAPDRAFSPPAFEGEGPDGGESVLPIAIDKVSPPTALPRLPDYTLEQKLQMELEYLEASISCHPLEILVPGELAGARVRSTELEEHLGETVSLVGWLIAQRRAVTKKRDYMQFLTFEDLSGTFEVTIFPRDYQRLGALVGRARVHRVTGKVSDRTGSVSLIAVDLEPLAPFSSGRDAEISADGVATWAEVEPVDSG
jgi:DNA-directed DNA polymerase III PolC